MSEYTIQLRNYIENFSYDQPFLSNRDKIELGRTKLFDFDYPIFDVNYKKILETHIIRNFYMREIGQETMGLFKFQLETWLLINMPYYNKLFESELIKFDPLVNSKSEATHTKKIDRNIDSKSDNSSNSSSSDNNFTRVIDSDNPDSRLSLTSNDGQGVIEYASNIQEDSENNSSSSNGSSNTTANTDLNETEDYVQSRVGKIGVQSYSKMLMEYRESMLRIEQKMFNEMQQLFMLVY